MEKLTLWFKLTQEKMVFPNWLEVAKNITDNYNSGDSNSSARMYVVLNAEMEKAVHDGLVSMELMEVMELHFGLDFIKT